MTAAWTGPLHILLLFIVIIRINGRDTATFGQRFVRAEIARCFLFEQLSGRAADDAPSALANRAFRVTVADFPRHLAPELAKALDEHAHDFLAVHGVEGEPVRWQPPVNLLDDLDLPGPDPDAVNVAELHGLIRFNAVRLGTAATRLHTSLENVRYLLQTHPAPRAQWLPGTQAPQQNRAYCKARATVSAEQFADLYVRQQMSLREIATSVGVSRQTIARLARDYDLPLREPHPYVRTTVDRDWLYDQYVTQRRALPDIAEEAGMSTANMARWAQTHAIPMRPQGGLSHSAALAAQRAVGAAPELIRPALAGIGGWERLQRFAAAASHPTLAVAAEELGLHQFTLVNQINRIERELGMTVLIRAQRGHSMQLTEDGARVMAAIRAHTRPTNWTRRRARR